MLAEGLFTTTGQRLLGPLLFKPRVFEDARGWFYESWNSRVFAELLVADKQGPAPSFVQDNHSCSRKGVLRGLHYQLPPHAQGKLVRCLTGSIVDVAVDIRRNSKTFGCWVSAVLSASNRQQLWIPSGFAHGFVSLQDGTEIHYKASAFWHRESERTIRWDDPLLAINWELERLDLNNPLLAEKDADAPSLEQARDGDQIFD